ncbi:MAG TPA: LON peptidase substrate-binding domain-containing protein [Chthoniobacteraceae bacterium]
MKSIGDQQLNLPAQAPIMVLPNALLFPNALLPLRIFEPRYRAMLENALEGQRMFCIALVRRGRDSWKTPEDFHDVAGLGLVRACVGHEDGTSDLVLQGIARVKLTAFTQEKPFVMAEIRELRSIAPGAYEAEALTAKLLALCAQLRTAGHQIPKSLDDQLAKIDNAEVLTDVVAQTFLQDPYRRQDVFEELRVGERLRLLIRHLSAEML